jgi:hypothetical protein
LCLRGRTIRSEQIHLPVLRSGLSSSHLDGGLFGLQFRELDLAPRDFDLEFELRESAGSRITGTPRTDGVLDLPRELLPVPIGNRHPKNRRLLALHRSWPAFSHNGRQGPKPGGDRLERGHHGFYRQDGQPQENHSEKKIHKRTSDKKGAP